MERVDYYELLGVDRWASSQNLREAFRARVLHTHPDLNPGDALASERTRLMVEAYKTLSSPASRRDYDSTLTRAQPVFYAPVYAEPVEVSYGPRAVGVLLAAALIVSLLIWAAVTILSNRVPIYRFDTTQLLLDPQPVHAALLVEPSISNYLEWYHAVEYQLGHSNALIAQEAAKVYTDAVRRAEDQGDHASAAFYKTSLEEMCRVQALQVPLAESERS